MEFQKDLWFKAEEEFLQIMQDGGVTVVYPDTSAFKDMVVPFYDDLEQSNPELFKVAEKIKKMAM